MMTCKELLEKFRANLDLLPYSNPADKKNDSYGGWVKDFHIHRKKGDNISLNLCEKDNDTDLFLLFVLAVIWSRSGPWEYSAFFVAYLKECEGLKNWDDVKAWCEKLESCKPEDFCKAYLGKVEKELSLDSSNSTNNGARKKLSLRKDAINSLLVLYKNWDEIKKSLDDSQAKGNYQIFIDHMRSIDGLAGPAKNGKTKRMRMKILLILRELRIQKRYKNIPGDLCCVPDSRVIKAAEQISDLKLRNNNTFENQIINSKLIYEKFGDWYDVPLFAYKDLQSHGLI
jgi:hypothetical protein